MDEITKGIEKIQVSSSNNKMIVISGRQEVWSTMMLVLEDISNSQEKQDEFDNIDEIFEIIPEITNYFGEDGFKHEKISKETDSVLLSLMDEYEDLIRAFRYYFCDSIVSDFGCAKAFQEINIYVDEHSDELVKEGLNVNMMKTVLQETIYFLNNDVDQYKYKNLNTLSFLPLHLSYDIRHIYFDAYEFLRYILND